MKYPRGAKIFVGQFDPLPYLGVFLCLLVFFLFFQSMIMPAGVVVELPSGGAAPPVSDQVSWRVVLDRKGNFYFENRQWDGEKLTEYFRDRIAGIAGADRPGLMLQADKLVTNETLTQALSQFQRAGFESIVVGWHTPSPGLAPRASVILDEGRK